ncbi:hypothetical protein PAP18089_03795 [Pandoraea apista]|uniref:Uncharacterized protein n=1 Tax=Pandoraea apista TaxID=93218 RepID=A0A5E5P9C2_9BURK|nr:hypothetical protein LMG16407_01540 [Pandoraea apista]VVG72795.1 hypothetical protein PAP18089_03795 [Pandoraea apista]
MRLAGLPPPMKAPSPNGAFFMAEGACRPEIARYRVFEGYACYGGCQAGETRVEYGRYRLPL